MFKWILRSMVLAALAVLVAIPAAAQIRAELGPLHIRIATEAPPRMRSERRMARPDRDAVWIRGCWHRQDDQWVWIAGRWDRRPDRHARWINARYQRQGRVWRYEPARWSNEQVTEGEDYQRWREEQRSDRGRRR